MRGETTQTGEGGPQPGEGGTAIKRREGGRLKRVRGGTQTGVGGRLKRVRGETQTGEGGTQPG